MAGPLIRIDLFFNRSFAEITIYVTNAGEGLFYAAQRAKLRSREKFYARFWRRFNKQS